jgi:hypothetical protein
MSKIKPIAVDADPRYLMIVRTSVVDDSEYYYETDTCDDGFWDLELEYIYDTE